MEAPPPASTNGDPPPPQKFRIMCSYGGHIIPRPRDRILSYIGGNTKIVLVDRRASIADLHARLSKTLDQNDPFLLKYQLPGEDLDSLVSVATDEDLHNMIEEHDRLRNTGRRLRLFLFATKVHGFDLGTLCGNNKGSSDERFTGVLNGKVKSLSAAFSDSLNCLIGLELDDGNGDNRVDSAIDEGLLLSEGPLAEKEKKSVDYGGITNRDAHSVPESPIIQTNSSPFGSTSSSKSAKIGGLGVDDRFQQLGAVLSNPNQNNVVDHKHQNSIDAVAGDPLNRVFTSNDGRSNHNGGQLQQKQASVGGLFEPISPDSISREGSLTNPMPTQRQDMQIQSANSNTDSNVIDQRNPEIQTQLQQIQESGSMLSCKYEYQHHHHHHHHHPTLLHHHPRQQFVRPTAQYLPGGPVPVADSYYPIYPSHHQNPPAVYFIQGYGEELLGQNASSNQPQKAPNMAYTRALNAPPLVQVPSSQGRSNYVDRGQVYYAAGAQPLAPRAHVVARYGAVMPSFAADAVSLLPHDDASLQNLEGYVDQKKARRTVQP